MVAAKYKALDITAEKVADGKPATVLGAMNDLIAITGDLRGRVRLGSDCSSAVSQAVVEKKTNDKDQYCRRRFGREVCQIPAG